jgi:hypothetical protein
MAATKNLISVSSFKVTISCPSAKNNPNRTESFTKADYGGIDHKIEKTNDGENNVSVPVKGMAESQNITLEKPYDPIEDPAFAKWIEENCCKNVTVRVVPVRLCGTETEYGTPWVVTGCLLAKLKLPTVDRNGSGVGVFMLEYATAGYNFENNGART